MQHVQNTLVRDICLVHCLVVLLLWSLSVYRSNDEKNMLGSRWGSWLYEYFLLHVLCFTCMTITINTNSLFYPGIIDFVRWNGGCVWRPTGWWPMNKPWLGRKVVLNTIKCTSTARRRLANLIGTGTCGLSLLGLLVVLLLIGVLVVLFGTRLYFLFGAACLVLLVLPPTVAVANLLWLTLFCFLSVCTLRINLRNI